MAATAFKDVCFRRCIPHPGLPVATDCPDSHTFRWLNLFSATQQPWPTKMKEGVPRVLRPSPPVIRAAGHSGLLLLLFIGIEVLIKTVSFFYSPHLMDSK